MRKVERGRREQGQTETTKVDGARDKSACWSTRERRRVSEGRSGERLRDGENQGKAGERERERSRYREEKETKGIETGDKPLIVEVRCSERRG